MPKSDETGAKVIDLMEALKASLARTEETQVDQYPPSDDPPPVVMEDFSDATRCRYFRVPGNGKTKGLSVAFRDDGAVGFQPVDERITGFSLTPAAALILRDLLIHGLGNPLSDICSAKDYALAVPEVSDAE